MKAEYISQAGVVRLPQSIVPNARSVAKSETELLPGRSKKRWMAALVAFGWRV